MFITIIKNRRGQGSSVEYAVLFFVVVAAISAMTVYSKRAIQARVRGARNYMWLQVNQTLNYTGNHIYAGTGRTLPVEYEPYYLRSETLRDEYSEATEEHRTWAGHEGRFLTGTDSSVTAATTANVASPRFAD